MLSVLVRNKLSGVPIVSSDGVIVANFSVSDVTSLAGVTNQADANAALALPVLTFLRERGGDDGVSLTPVVVYEEDSLGTVLQVLVESRLHHVYVVDEARQPQGVITLTDVIRFLVQALPTPPRA